MFPGNRKPFLPIDLPDFPPIDLPDLHDFPQIDLPDYPQTDLPDFPQIDLPDFHHTDLLDFPQIDTFTGVSESKTLSRMWWKAEMYSDQLYPWYTLHLPPSSHNQTQTFHLKP